MHRIYFTSYLLSYIYRGHLRANRSRLFSPNWRQISRLCPFNNTDFVVSLGTRVPKLILRCFDIKDKNSSCTEVYQDRIFTNANWILGPPVRVSLNYSFLVLRQTKWSFATQFNNRNTLCSSLYKTDVGYVAFFVDSPTFSGDSRVHIEAWNCLPSSTNGQAVLS